MSHVSRHPNPGLDAFNLYMEATHFFGPYQAFLLDSLNGPVTTPYEMSLLGLLPLVEIQVKSSVFTVLAEKQLARFLYDRFQERRIEKVTFTHDENLHYKTFAETFPMTGFHIHGGDPIDLLEKMRTVLQEIMGSAGIAPFGCGYLGYFGYDAIHYLENLPTTVVDDRRLPDIRLQLHGVIMQLTGKEVVIFNHLDEFTNFLPAEILNALKQKAAQFQKLVLSEQKETQLRHETFHYDLPQTAFEIIEDVPEEVFKDRVNRVKEYILNGDIFQAVISKRMRIQKIVHPYVAYAHLRQKNPSPYMFMAEYPEMRLFGTSPEVQFRAVGNQAQMKPIAGTSKGRGRTKEEDDQFRNDLLCNTKDKAEHLMLVDLCRNDLGRICKVGTVKVDEFMTVEAYTHLFHLVSTVNGMLKEGTNIFRALLSTFPAGTLSGAPKIRAMEIIDELEDFARGPYGGFVGMVDLFGNANTAIVIRSVIDTGDTYYVQAGAGIVADSDAVEEWKECDRKARAVLQVLTNRDLAISAKPGNSEVNSSSTSKFM